MTEKKRLKKVRKRNRIVKSHNFKVKTLEHLPVLGVDSSEEMKEIWNDVKEKNKQRRIERNG